MARVKQLLASADHSSASVEELVIIPLKVLIHDLQTRVNTSGLSEMIYDLCPMSKHIDQNLPNWTIIMALMSGELSPNTINIIIACQFLQLPFSNRYV